jgi:hypothetical protein
VRGRIEDLATPAGEPSPFQPSSRALCPGPLCPPQAREGRFAGEPLAPHVEAEPGVPGTRPGMTAQRWKLGLASAALLALAACGPAKTPAAPPPPQAVEAVAVSAPRASGGVTATGTLERRREMALSFRIAGVLTKVAVEAGDPVRAGQVLASIDPAAVDARQQAIVRPTSTRPAATWSAPRPSTPRAIVTKVRVDDAESAVRSAGAAFNSRRLRPALGAVGFPGLRRGAGAQGPGRRGGPARPGRGQRSPT